MSAELAENLKRSFRERCLAFVNRGLGQVAIAPDVTIEASFVPEEDLVSFTTIQHGLDAQGKQRAVWTDLLLDANGRLTKHLETTITEPRPGDPHPDDTPSPLSENDIEAAIETIDSVLLQQSAS